MVVTRSSPVINNQPNLFFVADGQQPAATGWAADVRNNGASADNFKVAVICAPTG
jgi:hypothetical protein